ncbi:MAG: T9SS type A sorting domain-containing protein [Phaeodactylibacter sp.]|nr:T9SS type A sorting domain-containing protein [Phaeodactylibacter sp.]MCB9273824.1 T9SS type A sorting domain-containing protein [Lewinellaceae bacterium]
MNETKLLTASLSNWFNAASLALIFGFAGLQQTTTPRNDDYHNAAGAAFKDCPWIRVCDGACTFDPTRTVLKWYLSASFPDAITAGPVAEAYDYTLPIIDCPLVDYGWGPQEPVYPTYPFFCAASFTVPLPEVTDDCPSWEILTEVLTIIEVEDYGPDGNLIGAHSDTVVLRTIPWNAPTRVVSGMPRGNNYFRYTFTNACGYEVVTYCKFYIEDQAPPVVNCNNGLQVSIGVDGFARIFAEDFGSGSWDNCGDYYSEVRRNQFDPISYNCGTAFSDWGPYVDFYCCDVGDTVTIELRVTDYSGNADTCWLDVVPEEHLPPYCSAPQNTSIGCDSLPPGFDIMDTSQLQALFGAPGAADNCEVEAMELPPVPNLECGFGTIIRRFSAEDIHGNQSNNFCEQVVTINEVHNYEIRFPADASWNCGTTNPDSVEVVEELACDLLAVTYTDEFAGAAGDECYEILRMWSVLNWCQYDGESDPLVVSRDEDCDAQPGDEAVWVLHRPNGYTYIDRDDDEEEPNDVPTSFQNICWGIDGFWRQEEEAHPGYYQYLQIIKVYDAIAPEITFTQQGDFCSYDNINCDGVVAYPFKVNDYCTPVYLAVKVYLDANADGAIDSDLTNTGALSGTYPNYTITGEFPIGCHAFEVQVEDGCGNSDTLLLPFCVIDCMAPSPTCISGIAPPLMPFDSNGDGIFDTGQTVIWASDFITSTMSDCTGPVTYSINRSGSPADPGINSLTLTCADTGTLVVEIWAWDGAGNGDFCESYILPMDIFDLCAYEPIFGIFGTITTEADSAVEGMQVTMTGQGFAVVITGADGGYAFTGVQQGYDYTVTPQCDSDYLNGVSTYDILLISKHILGIQPLDSPYKRIAADVNNSHTISALDMLQLRKLILAIDTVFTNNTSWRFVKRAYTFPDPDNPWLEPFPEVAIINNLPYYLDGQDFIAIKIGDLNLDAETNGLTEVEKRDIAGVFAFQVADAVVKAGNTYTVRFATGSADVDGYQGTLMFDNAALELVDIVNGAATEEHFGLTRLREGAAATSWNGKVEAGQNLFSLVFEAKANGQLSELLSISDLVTKAEAYNRAGEYMDVAIQFSTGEINPIAIEAGFELYQNRPNPFKGETVIGFALPADAQVTMTISDVTGRVVRLVRADGVKGYNQVAVNANGLPAGILAYTVSAGAFTATRKMVVMEQ